MKYAALTSATIWYFAFKYAPTAAAAATVSEWSLVSGTWGKPARGLGSLTQSHCPARRRSSDVRESTRLQEAVVEACDGLSQWREKRRGNGRKSIAVVCWRFCCRVEMPSGINCMARRRMRCQFRVHFVPRPAEDPWKRRKSAAQSELELNTAHVRKYIFLRPGIYKSA